MKPMKKKTSALGPALIILLVAGVYSVILFSLKTGMTGANWVGYGFTLLAFALLAVNALSPKGFSERKAAAWLPVSLPALVYFCATFLLGGVAAVLLPGLPVLLVLAVCLVLLAIYLFFALRRSKGGSEKKTVKEKTVARDISAMRLLTGEVESLAALAEDESLRNRLRNLADDIRYSDPVSTPELRDLEERIQSNISILREEVEEGKAAQALQRAQNIQRFVEERNRKCLALKK